MKAIENLENNKNNKNINYQNLMVRGRALLYIYIHVGVQPSESYFSTGLIVIVHPAAICLKVSCFYLLLFSFLFLLFLCFICMLFYFLHAQ